MNEGRDTSANKTHLFNWLHDMTVQMGRGRRERVDWVGGGRGASASSTAYGMFTLFPVIHPSMPSLCVYVCWCACECVSLGLTSSHPSLRGCEPGTR